MRPETQLGCSSGVIKPCDREKRLGNLGGYTGGNFAYQVFHPDGLSPALLNMGNGGGRMPHIVVSYEKCCTEYRA